MRSRIRDVVGYASLLAGLDRETLRKIVGAGRNNLPGLSAIYSGAELDDVVHYIVEALATD